MGFVRYKSTGDMLMAESGISSSRSKFAFTSQESQDHEALDCRQDATNDYNGDLEDYNLLSNSNEINSKSNLKLSASNKPKKQESDIKQALFKCDNFKEENNNYNLDNLHATNKWSSCKFLLSNEKMLTNEKSPWTRLEFSNKHDENQKSALCKSTGDFLSLLSGKLHHNSTNQSSKTPKVNPLLDVKLIDGDRRRQRKADRRRQMNYGHKLATPVTANKRRVWRSQRFEFEPTNGARRTSRVLVSLSKSSPMLNAEEAHCSAKSTELEQEKCLIVAMEQLKKPRQSMQQQQHQQPRLDVEDAEIAADKVDESQNDGQLDSFKSAFSNSVDDNGFQDDIRGVGGKLNQWPRPSKEQSSADATNASQQQYLPLSSAELTIQQVSLESALSKSAQKPTTNLAQQTSNQVTIDITPEGACVSARELVEINNNSNQQNTSRKSNIIQSQVDAVRQANNKLLALSDLNFAASKLMDSCSGWRQALPASSGFYKVAGQQQQQQISKQETKRHLISQQKQQNLPKQSRQEVVLDLNSNPAANYQDERNQLEFDNFSRLSTARSRVSRFPSRPGRSPASIQRQTNARLAKHRQKIQQQRQEQLAQLALRSRNLLRADQDYSSSSSSSSSSSASNQHTTRIEIPTTNPLRHLSSSSNNHQKQINSLNNPAITFTQIAQNPYTTSRTINISTSRPSSHARAIEICDNQQACSSSSGSSGGDSINTNSLFALTSSSSSNQQQRHSFRTNVVPHKATTNTHRMPMNNYIAQDESITQEEPSGVEDGDCDTINSSNGSTFSLNKPFCKICHVGNSKPGDKLISPCRCSGTMQYIHCGCLLRWLRVSNKTSEPAINCELCSYEYKWHKRFNYKHIRWPRMSLKDLFLHLIFVLALGIMLFSALAPILTSRKSMIHQSLTGTSVSNQPVPTKAASGSIEQQLSAGTASYRLSPNAISSGSSNNPNLQNIGGPAGKLVGEEKLMLICAASFFVSFFLAVYAQTKTRDTLYGFIMKFLDMNQTFYITEFDHGQSGNGDNNNTNNNNINNVEIINKSAKMIRKMGVKS